MALNRSASTFSVLLVGNDDDTRAAYGRALAAARFAVMQASDGLEALAATTKYLPDVIVTDTPVRKIDALALISCLQASVRTAGIPVLVLTGDTQTLTAAAAATGAAFLTKPCPPDVVVSEVSRLIDAAHPSYPRAAAMQFEHARLQECTSRLMQSHAALRRERAVFDVLDHHEHLDALRRHLAALATHRHRLRKSRRQPAGSPPRPAPPGTPH